MRPSIRCLFLVVFVAAPLFGQVPSGAALTSLLESGVDAPLLLANPGVKKEIKLTDKQYNQVRKVIAEVFDKYKPEFQKAGRDHDKLMKVGEESTQETRERLRKALPDILKPEQLKRLNQIQIQVNGIASFKRPEVQEELNLTDGQKRDIAQIGDGLKHDLEGLIKDVSSAPLRKMPGAMRKGKELKDEATKKAVAKLSEEQQRKWKEMNGEKFDFHPQLPLPGRSGR